MQPNHDRVFSEEASAHMAQSFVYRCMEYIEIDADKGTLITAVKIPQSMTQFFANRQEISKKWNLH